MNRYEIYAGGGIGMYGNNIQQYLHELSQYIRKQDEAIETLNQRMDKLENELKRKNNTTIEKVEYKFDQLKVETLSGTLHIGISPEELSNMDNLALGQSTSNTAPPDQKQLTNDLQQYVQKNGIPMINQFSEEYRNTIDESEYPMIMKDIQRQIPLRIDHYDKETFNSKKWENEEERREFIFNCIIDEIHHSLRNFVKNYKQGEKK